GREQGFSCLHARTEDIAKLGLLYLQGGQWEGAQLIGEKWVAEAASQQVANPTEPNPDWRQGYGFQFWMSRHGYRGDGAYGQFCVILPEQDAVVVTTASTPDMQAVLDAMWAHLLPALGRSDPDVGAQEQLASRLGGLELPAYQADGQPRDWEPWLREPFRIAAAEGDPQSQPTLASIGLQRAGAGLQVTLNEVDNALSFGVGTRGWTVSTPADTFGKGIPVAAAGGWSDQKTLRLEVIFLETPHRMDIVCSVGDRSASVA